MNSDEELLNMQDKSVFSKNCINSDSIHSDELMKFNEEKCRLTSFVSWPSHYPVNPSRLAKAGFYYTGKGDEVVCFSCNGHLSDWEFGAVVQKRHIESFPHCNFINHKSNNVPLLNDKTIMKRDSESVLVKTVTSFQDKTFEHFKEITASDVLDGNNNDNLNCVITQKNTMFIDKFSQEHFKSIEKSKFKKMKCEKERLKTFLCGWPVPSVSVDLLAKAGFFYTGFKDKVQCAFCDGIVKNWQYGDDPIIEHKKHFPFCEFVLKCDVTSSVVGDANPQNISKELSFLMNCKLFNQVQQNTLNELGINMYEGPAHPHFAIQTARLQSFSTWPHSSPVSKESLSAAGFFYIGVSDRTKCFHCGGGLHSWEKEDDPWVEHARWFQNCGFIRLNKGTTFINAVKNLRKCESMGKSGMLSKNFRICKKKIQNKTKYSIGISSEQLELTETAREVSNVNCVTSFSKVSSDNEGVTPAEFDSFRSIKNDILPNNGNTGCQDNCQDFLSHNKDAIVMDDQGLCKVCMDNEVNVAFLPCGHVLACNHCAALLSECPTCCKAIQATVKVYLQ